MSRNTRVTGQFRRVAEAIALRMAQTLEAEIAVSDERGRIVARSESQALKVTLPDVNRTAVRVPLQLDGQTGEVAIMPASEEGISPRLAQTLVDLMVHQMMIVRLPNQQELKNKLIYTLLRGTIDNEAEILREGEILGMDLSRPRAVILIDAREYILATTNPVRLEAMDSQIWRRAQVIVSSIVSFFHLPNDTICAYIGDGEIAVLKASSTQDLTAWTSPDDMPAQLNSSWANLTALKRASNALLKQLRCDTQAPLSIGLGRHHPGLSGLAKSYQDARAALSLGRRYRGENRVHCLDELGIAAFVGIADEQTKIDLARHLLSPLDQEAELLETLNVFFQENCHPSSTATQLSIHRNTLSYRLDKITSLTGLDPRQFDDAMQIRMALLLRCLQEESHPLCSCPIHAQRKSTYARQLPNVSFG